MSGAVAGADPSAGAKWCGASLTPRTRPSMSGAVAGTRPNAQAQP
jgi:hypothetical protein